MFCHSHVCEFILDRRQIGFKCSPLTSVYVVLILLCQLETETDVSLRYQKLRELPKHCPGHLVSKISHLFGMFERVLCIFVRVSQHNNYLQCPEEMANIAGFFAAHNTNTLSPNPLLSDSLLAVP